MNFNETILTLTQYLQKNHFSIANSSHHFIKYSSDSVTITVAYNDLEHLFYTHVGDKNSQLIELTPAAVKAVFNEPSFEFQSTLTIENIISFLQDKGQPILFGDIVKLKELKEFSDNRSREFTEHIVHLQHLKSADFAWKRKDYQHFIESIQKTNQNILPESYHKKYKIALDRIRKHK